MTRWTRRGLFTIGSVGLLGLSVPHGQQTQANPNQLTLNPSSTDPDILIFLFLRGGCDGLNLVAPVNDPHYVAARQAELRLGEHGRQAGLYLKNPPAEADFRLHPRASELKDLYDDGHLAFIHACGLTHGTRSHFEAQDLIERGSLTHHRLHQGWITRYLNQSQLSGHLPVVAMSTHLPTSLQGCTAAVAIPSLEEFEVPGDDLGFTLLKSFYAGPSDPVRQAGSHTLQTVRTLQQSLDLQDEIDQLPSYSYYPDDEGYELGRSLQSVAHLIKLDVGLRVATIDYGDWDTHTEQPDRFPGLVTGLSKALGAFYKDLDQHRHQVTVVIMSEFGRRLKGNESHGTDHGYGNVAMVLGGSVNGGHIYGTWPGLAHEHLDDGTDLAITTDYRQILSEVLVQRLGTPWQTVFPELEAYQPLGLVS